MSPAPIATDVARVKSDEHERGNPTGTPFSVA